MKKLCFAIAVLLLSMNANAQSYDITKYGIDANDSVKLNTKAIQHVIDLANENGGGEIFIPKGVYLTGALFFKPKTKLTLAQGAVLKGSDNIEDYPLIPSRMEGKNLLYYAALINAYYIDSFSISGPGTINGNGLKFWESFWSYREAMKKINKEATNLDAHRPRLVFLWGCNNATIQNVKLCNSGFWTTHLYQCNNVLIEGCDIRSQFRPVKAPSTDGVDIDACKKVTIRNCYISVNDDGVCIKGGKGPDAQNTIGNGIVEDILIEGCTFGETHGILTLGSECIHAKNIIIRNCKLDNDCPILRLKMRPDTYQLFEDIHVSNMTGKCGTVISMNPWKQFYNMEGSTAKPYGIVRNITMTDINVECARFGEMEGNALDTVSNIVFSRINVKATTPIFKNKYTTGVQFNQVTMNGVELK